MSAPHGSAEVKRLQKAQSPQKAARSRRVCSKAAKARKACNNAAKRMETQNAENSCLYVPETFIVRPENVDWASRKRYFFVKRLVSCSENVAFAYRQRGFYIPETLLLHAEKVHLAF